MPDMTKIDDQISRLDEHLKNLRELKSHQP